MSDYRSWRPIYNAMCPEPGAHDLFLVILINGRRVAIQDAGEHERWKVAAERLAKAEQCQVKVLPMTGDEMMGFLGMTCAPPQPIDNLDPAFRDAAVQNCMNVLRDGVNARERGEALELLGHLGVLQ